MCKSLWVYPLIKFKDESQKVLFNYGVCLKDREEASHLHELKLDFLFNKFAGAKLQSLNNIILDKDFSQLVKFVNIPCGCCSDCLKDRSRQWAIRILKEAERFPNNYYVTFTYDDDHLPKNYNLVQDEISKLNKKLKTYLNRKNLKSDFRFYGVGEYGGKTARPHYHVIYFNLDLPSDDLTFYRVIDGNLYFNSKILDEVWGKGFAVVSDVTVGSASYVARYVDKKRLLTKMQKEEFLQKGIVPEFSVMSRRPGIGADYLEQVISNLSNGIYTIPFKDNNFNIPMYFSKKLKEILKDTDVLNKYLEQAKLKQSIKIANDLRLSDIVDDVQLLYESENYDKIKSKKLREIK